MASAAAAAPGGTEFAFLQVCIAKFAQQWVRQFLRWFSFQIGVWRSRSTDFLGEYGRVIALEVSTTYMLPKNLSVSIARIEKSNGIEMMLGA